MYVIQQEPRVFVVDDDAPVRRSLGRLLHTAGYEVELLPGAEAYLERAVPTRPACLLLDMRMPGMGGMELKHRITGTARELPVIFITAHGDEALRQALIQRRRRRALQAAGRRRAARGGRAGVEDVRDPRDRGSRLTLGRRYGATRAITTSSG